MIEGVHIKKLKVIPDERGRLMEMLRADDEIYLKFGQVYMTTAYPGAVKRKLLVLLGSDQAKQLKIYNKALKNRVFLGLRRAFLTPKIGV